MEESERTIIFLKTANRLMDEVFSKVADLRDKILKFVSGIRYRSVCLELKLRPYERSLSSFIKVIFHLLPEFH